MICEIHPADRVSPLLWRKDSLQLFFLGVIALKLINCLMISFPTQQNNQNRWMKHHTFNNYQLKSFLKVYFLPGLTTVHLHSLDQNRLSIATLSEYARKKYRTYLITTNTNIAKLSAHTSSVPVPPCSGLLGTNDRDSSLHSWLVLIFCLSWDLNTQLFKKQFERLLLT